MGPVLHDSVNLIQIENTEFSFATLLGHSLTLSLMGEEISGDLGGALSLVFVSL